MTCVFSAAETMEKLSKLNKIEARETTLSATLWIRLRVQEYRCESNMTLFRLGSLKITRINGTDRLKVVELSM